MVLARSAILDWIEASSQPPHPRKRRCPTSTADPSAPFRYADNDGPKTVNVPLSPPPTNLMPAGGLGSEDAPDTPTRQDGRASKRPRHDIDDDPDIDRTPTQRGGGGGGGGDATSSVNPPVAFKPRNVRIAKSDTDASEDSLSIKSGNSSPSRQLRSLELHDSGFDRRQFGTVAMPPQLKSLYLTISNRARGIGVVPSALRDQLEQQKERLGIHALEFATDHVYFSPEAHLTTDRTIAPVDAVLELLEQAADCETEGHDEASWNLEVHAPLLRLVFRNCDLSPRPEYRLIDFVSCTTARILPAFRHRRPGSSKMVDFCVAVHPRRQFAADADLRPRLHAAMRQCQGESVNHTDYPPLIDKPIVLSIETKKGAEHGDKATLQIGTWMAAQLRSLARSSNYQVTADVDGNDTQSSQEGEKVADFNFVPGLIIHGHEWNFVANMIGENGRSIHLGNLYIGSTQTPLGIYQIIAVLDTIRVWARDKYWPLFKKRVLGYP